MEHRSSTVVLHWFLSWACRSIWVHCRPICRRSCSADLLQLFFGLPRFRLLWRFQKSACLVTLLCGFLSVWPIHLHFFLLVWVVISLHISRCNRPRSIYQYSNMAPRLSGQTSIFGVIFFVFKSLLGIESQKKLRKFTFFTRKPRSHVRILIYRPSPIGDRTQPRAIQ